LTKPANTFKPAFTGHHGIKPVTNPIVVNRSTFVDQLVSLEEENDVEGFLALCSAVKQTAIHLMEQNKRRDASDLMADYAKVFESNHLKMKNPQFILNTLEVYPNNHFSTMHLLGISDELDTVILRDKINMDEFDPTEESGCESFLEWATDKKKWALTGQFINDIVKRTHELYEEDHKAQRAVGNTVVGVLVRSGVPTGVLPKGIDETIESLLDSPASFRNPGSFIERLAELDMPKTLMTMLEQGMLGSHTGSKSNMDQITRHLPENMTLRQLHAVHFHLGLPGLNEKILFDESIDMSEYISVLADTHYGYSGSDDLHLSGIKPFVKLFTPKNFKIPTQRNRALQLLEAMLGSRSHRKSSNEELRAHLNRYDVPEFAVKYLKRFRGEELEGAMGL
jgi:hypothetical protein